MLVDHPAMRWDIKQSGIGRVGGPEGLQEYLDVKYAIFANRLWR